MPMDVSSYAIGSCAASQITNLGSCKDPVDAMTAFCKLEMGSSGFGSKSAYAVLTPYYLFIAGPEIPGKGHSKKWVRYGTEFAAYIVDNGLGEVATLGPKVNTRYHPDTTCQVWAWSPNQKAMEAWWTARKHELNNPKPQPPAEPPKEEP